MRRSWLQMALLGFLLGPAALAVDSPDDAVEAERASSGFAVRGAGFYVWDEDAREALAWAEELGADPAEPAEGADVGALLRALSPLERTWLISSWATSTNEPTRRMLARALAEPIESVGARWALEHLQRDPSAEVRRLASAALAAQRGLDV